MNSPAADALILQPQWTSSGKLNINFKEFLWWFMLYKFRSVVKFYFLSLNHSWSLTNPACSLMTVIIQLDTTEQKSLVLSCVIFIAIPTLLVLPVQLVTGDMSKCQRACAHVGLHIGLDDADRIWKFDPFNIYLLFKRFSNSILDKLTTYNSWIKQDDNKEWKNPFK